MGPSVLFDKSAIQSLGQNALQEVNRYFYTVLPPVLLMETLADLSITPDDLDDAKRKVAVVANKLLPFDSIANANFRSMCIHNLLGEFVPMNRKPAVSGCRSANTKDGSKGVIIDIQSENEALLRWRSGSFNEDDMKFAVQWRESAKSMNLEAMKQALPKRSVTIQSVEQVGQVVDLMLADPELQESLFSQFLSWLECPSDMSDRIRLRWKWSVRSLQTFAPYAYHCLRVQLIFYAGMIHGYFGTRPSNIVDLEYLYYTPFAFVFCSGDKLHKQLAPLVLQVDQSFVERDEMQTAVNDIAAERKKMPDVMPNAASLIRKLWQKHWKRSPEDAMPRPISKEESEQIMETMRPIIETLREQPRQSGPRFPV